MCNSLSAKLSSERCCVGKGETMYIVLSFVFWVEKKDAIFIGKAALI